MQHSIPYDELRYMFYDQFMDRRGCDIRKFFDEEFEKVIGVELCPHQSFELVDQLMAFVFKTPEIEARLEDWLEEQVREGWLHEFNGEFYHDPVEVYEEQQEAWASVREIR